MPIVPVSTPPENDEALNEDQMEMIEGMIAELDDQKSNGPPEVNNMTTPSEESKEER